MPSKLKWREKYAFFSIRMPQSFFDWTLKCLEQIERCNVFFSWKWKPALSYLIRASCWCATPNTFASTSHKRWPQGASDRGRSPNASTLDMSPQLGTGSLWHRPTRPSHRGNDQLHIASCLVHIDLRDSLAHCLLIIFDGREAETFVAHKPLWFQALGM